MPWDGVESRSLHHYALDDFPLPYYPCVCDALICSCSLQPCVPSFLCVLPYDSLILSPPSVSRPSSPTPLLSTVMSTLSEDDLAETLLYCSQRCVHAPCTHTSCAVCLCRSSLQSPSTVCTVGRSDSVRAPRSSAAIYSTQQLRQCRSRLPSTPQLPCPPLTLLYSLFSPHQQPFDLYTSHLVLSSPLTLTHTHPHTRFDPTLNNLLLPPRSA
jgi:hypothetical protein